MSENKITQEQIPSEDALFAKHLQVFEILDDTRMTEEESDERNKRGWDMLTKIKEVGPKRIDKDKLKKLVVNLSIKDIEKMVAALQKFLEGKIKEKISGPKERYEGKLESALTPLIKFNYGENPTKVLSEIYYRLVKNHPFIDGNKKIAVAFLLSVLSKLDIDPSDQDIADITIYVARSEAKEYAAVVEKITRYLESG